MLDSLSHLKKLSQIKTGAGIPFLTPEVSPGTHCPMRMASVIVEDIKGLSSLLVGMPECATHSRLFSPYPEGAHGELHWLYVLDSREVVFGCRDGVMDALKKMDQEGAESILVIATCVPDLIGEDFESLLQEIQLKISACVAFTMLGQFKHISYPTGSWKTMEALASLMTKETTVTNRINILGRSPKETHIPMNSFFPYLQSKGMSLRFLAPGASMNDFKEAPDAALNLVVSPYMQPLAMKMKKKFGIPFVSLHNCFSVEDIDNAYTDVANRFGFFYESTFEIERSEALALQIQAEELCRGLTYVLALRIDLVLPLTRYFISDLGMKPLLIHLEEYYPEDQAHVKAIHATGYDPLVCRIVNEYTAFQVIRNLCPDICFGYLPNVDNSIPWITDMFDFYGQTGYKRTTAILKRLLCAVKNEKAPKKGGTHGTSSF